MASCLLSNQIRRAVLCVTSALLFVCVLNGFAGALIIILSPKESNNVQGPNISIHKGALIIIFSPKESNNI